MSLTARDLNAALWAAADEMRLVMSADVYKDYLLGLVFYKALSDKILVEAYELLIQTPPCFGMSAGGFPLNPRSNRQFPPKLPLVAPTASP